MVPWDEVPSRYKMDPAQLVDFEADIMYKEAVIHVARRQDGRSLGDWHNPSIIISADGAAASVTALGNSRFIQDSEGNTRRLRPSWVSKSNRAHYSKQYSKPKTAITAKLDQAKTVF